MNNGYQKYNGCRADKEGGKFFNTFFYPELQSKHVSPLAYNVPTLGEGGDFKHKFRCGERMLNIAVNVKRSTAKPLLPNVCYMPPFFNLEIFFENVCKFKIKM